MEYLKKDPILEFHPDTVNAVRKVHGFESANMKEAVDALDAWVKKQNHFLKKDFCRHYLEMTIISSKGSVERAKARLDKICASRSLSPQYFGDYDYKNDFKEFDGIFFQAVLPKLTDDYSRVLMIKNSGKKFQSNMLLQFIRMFIMLLEYVKLHDYYDGFILIVDLRDISLFEMIRKLNPVELRQAATIMIEGYGMRIKGLHLLSTSRIINVFVWIVKQVLSAKIISRIHVHQTMKSLYNFVAADILPSDYGGKERPLVNLQDEWAEILSSAEYRAYLKEISKACTDEARRQTDPESTMPQNITNINID